MIVPLLCFFFVVIAKAFSTTHVVYPLDDQLPLVARVNQSWSWTFSERTFNSTDGPVAYSTPSLPAWLSFNPNTRTFSGTPTADDEGNPRVTVVATTPQSTASSAVDLCVTHYPPPTMAIPISDQFNPSNHALSSVFVVSPGSALAAVDPGLRMPSGPWSFSIGFEGRTFTSENDLFYAVRLADGSDIPDWMVFDRYDITLDGVVPANLGLSGPVVYSLVLVASDQEGYTAETLPFQVTIANHELSAVAQGLPTINVTAGSAFTASLLSPADFTGLFVDDGPLQPSNITSLAIDTQGLDWLKYDATSRTLFGTPGSNLPTTTRFSLPATVSTSFNQSLKTTIPIQLVPSYFTLPELPALHLSPGEYFELDLTQFYSNSTAGHHGDANLSLLFEPSQAGNFISLDLNHDTLSGTIPATFSSDHLTVTFTAYSQITHSTSHANLIIFVDVIPGRNGAVPDPTNLTAEARHRLILGLAITFGTVGGLSLLGCFFAWFKRVVQVGDSALLGEEGRLAWTKQERRYYGLDLSSEKSSNSLRSPQESQLPLAPMLGPVSRASSMMDGHQRVSERTRSPNENSDMDSTMMSKREFMSKVKQTVRQVSSKYNLNRLPRPQASVPRPMIIGRPILLRPSGLLDSTIGSQMGESPSNPFDDAPSQRTSTIISGSPSTSTGEHSIPRRRADFAPPRTMAQVHFEDGHLIRRPSNTSIGSDRHGDAASKRASVRSGRSTSRLSHEYYPDAADGLPVRPRLVPFTSSTRVPVPRVSSMIAEASNGDLPAAKATKSRIASQRAKVIKPPGSPTGADAIRKSGSGDELSMGLHYMQSLGVDQPSPPPPNDEPQISSRTIRQEVTRYVVRTGEKFQIRLQIPVTTKRLQVKQVSGQDLPKYLNVDANGAKGMVEFTGTALSRDLGMLTIGVYMEKECVSRVILEVIPRR